ncbi:MAG: ABC transporter substrate-binding protein [Thermostichales cyanobacterium DRC_bins_46]
MRRRQLLGLGLGAALVSACRSPHVLRDPRSLSWEQIQVQARGSRVSFAMWGGSDRVNQFVDGWVAEQMQQRYQVQLRRVPLADTTDAVNKILGEVQAGRTRGSLDLIWINGENFRTLKQGDLLFGPFAEQLPSWHYYNPALVSTDFGLPTEGYEAPYTGTYFVMAAHSARVPNPPQTMAELLSWAAANPGRFAYVAPPAFDGNRFLLMAFYGVSGGYQQYLGPDFNPGLWDANAPLLLDFLKTLAPHLWRQTYPPNQNRLADLFANGEIWLAPMFINRIAEGINTGQFPSTTIAYAMPGLSLNDPSFTAIPINAPNPAAAMLLADLLASPPAQLGKFPPAVWGDPPLVDVNRLNPAQQAAFAQVEQDYGIPLGQITENLAPIINAEYTTRLQRLWVEHFGS